MLSCMLVGCYLGRPWPKRYTCSSCTTNVYKLATYAGERGVDPDPCGLTVVYKISPPLNLVSRDIDCTEWNRQ